MSDLSSRVSLREIVGGVAPGLMVIASFIYVAARIPTLEVGWNAFGTGWSALLVIFVLAYGVGTMLKSGTEFAFERVTQMGQLRVTPAAAPNVLPKGWAERLARMVEPLVKRLALYLGGGKDIAALNRDFRDSWHRRAVVEGVVSGRLFETATTHYRELFESEPEGEEALIMCEYYIRKQTPGAMQDIEENAAKALLMGNLIIPMLCWLFAACIGIVLSVMSLFSAIASGGFSWSFVLSLVTQALALLLLFIVFPYFVNMIGQQWAETSRARVKLVLVAFTIACRVSRGGRRCAFGLLNRCVPHIALEPNNRPVRARPGAKAGSEATRNLVTKWLNSSGRSIGTTCDDPSPLMISNWESGILSATSRQIHGGVSRSCSPTITRVGDLRSASRSSASCARYACAWRL